VHGRHFRFRSPLLPTLNVGSSALALDWLSSRANNATLGGKCIASKPSNIGQLSGLFYLNIPKCVKHKEDPSNQLQFAGSVGRGETTTVSRPDSGLSFQIPLSHYQVCARVRGGESQRGPDSMRIAVSGRRSAKCELYGLFLTGRRGYSRDTKKTGCTIRPTPSEHLRPHLCVRPTPSPSIPSPLRTPYALA
jgi:hypothetical protein